MYVDFIFGGEKSTWNKKKEDQEENEKDCTPISKKQNNIYSTFSTCSIIMSQ